MSRKATSECLFTLSPWAFAWACILLPTFAAQTAMPIRLLCSLRGKANQGASRSHRRWSCASADMVGDLRRLVKQYNCLSRSLRSLSSLPCHTMPLSSRSRACSHKCHGDVFFDLSSSAHHFQVRVGDLLVLVVPPNCTRCSVTRYADGQVRSLLTGLPCRRICATNSGPSRHRSASGTLLRHVHPPHPPTPAMALTLRPPELLRCFIAAVGGGTRPSLSRREGPDRHTAASSG